MRAAALAFTAPDPDQGEEGQQVVVEIRTQPEVRSVGQRDIAEGGDIAVGGLPGPFGGSGNRPVTATGDVLVGHDSSVMSRYTA